MWRKNTCKGPAAEPSLAPTFEKKEEASVTEFMNRSGRAMAAEKKAEAGPTGSAGHGEGPGFCSKTNGSQRKTLSRDGGEWCEEK